MFVLLKFSYIFCNYCIYEKGSAMDIDGCESRVVYDLTFNLQSDSVGRCCLSNRACKILFCTAVNSPIKG